MASGLKKRNDILATSLVDESGAVHGIYTRCPHCGMVDLRHMNQGIKQTHFQNWKVGGVGKYDCGKCRHTFHTIEIQVPVGVKPMELYEQINAMLQQENERRLQ